LIATSEAEVRCANDGLLLAALSYVGEDTPQALEETARRARGWITSTFRRADDVELIGVDVGIRPMPADGVPIVGRLTSPDGADGTRAEFAVPSPVRHLPRPSWVHDCQPVRDRDIRSLGRTPPAAGRRGLARP
jgi:hypothetical protein